MTENKIYAVATSHLDTVWRWNLAKTINEFLPDTLEKNFDLIEKYPNYKMNFEGAYRYHLIEEYYPLAFEELKKKIEEGSWNVSGSQYENGDVNIPSPEALFRNINYGNSYFEKKFGKRCKDLFLPDGFGFGWALPSIAKHSNLSGFTTQKLGWGAAYERPFDLGIWRGVDGSEIYAVLNPLSYRNKFNGDIRANVQVVSKLADAGINCALPWTMALYGTGDWGGAPTELSAKSVEYSVRKNAKDENTKVISASTDEMFKDLEKLPNSAKSGLPLWNNELVMRSHGAGSYTSRAMSKRLNAQNEVLADKTERACVAANLLTSYNYPTDNIDDAWKRVIAHQFHDDITGTATMEVYNDSFNDYYLSLLQFRNEYEGAAGAVANELDTSWCEECAIIVHNSVAIKRKECVEAHIKLNHNSKYVAVFDKSGKEVPSQVIRKQGKEFDIVFLADMPSASFKVYDIRKSDKKCSIKTDLSVSEHILENEKYRLIFNKNGDIASVIDKSLNSQILEKPIKLALFSNIGELNYPSWEIRKEDLDKEPYLYANTPEFEILENGPARIAVKVSRHAQNSKIEQVVSLGAHQQFIRVENFIDWQERRTLLKAVFPFACKNEEATYDLGLGCIRRGNNKENLYEVPAQKWADISGEDFGVSIFSDCKYAWDKPADNTLRLTCIHTPAGAFTKDARQDLQDLGRNIFSFGIFSHKGDLSSKTSQQSQFFISPLTAFQTSSRREGSLEDSFSLLSVSSNSVIIRAIKKSDSDDDIIIRV
ncbi:MAG: alpha-mannosidase, partial [Eubacterium sp.]|nr:alpha-mannosidase [Eubacterium sp.]